MNGSPDREALIKDLNSSQGWELGDSLSLEQLEELLTVKLNEWIRSDFNALIQFLYRVDVSESRLRVLLNENAGEDAGKIMARLVMERLGQKIETRRQFRAGDAISDEERW